MNKLALATCSFLIFSSCQESPHAKYYKNLTTTKTIVEKINHYFSDSTSNKLDISTYYTEDFMFHSFPSGTKKGIQTLRTEYINGFDQMKAMNMSLNIGHSIYLPGIAEQTFEFDGSVRVYYGATICRDTNCVDFSGYQTINFDNNKVSAIWEWADYGGVSNSLFQ